MLKKILLSVLFLIPWTVFPLENSTYGKPLWKTFIEKIQSCYQGKVLFEQENQFAGSVDYYTAQMEKKDGLYRVIYFTQPPFVVVYKNGLVTVGYEGEEKQTFELSQYPNPILKILFNLPRLEDYFEIIPRSEYIFLLKPKTEDLKEVLTEAVVYFDPKTRLLKRIFLSAGEDNTVNIVFQKWDLEKCKNR
jgi:outer membrane lipoprotein-sorting protein